MSPVAMALDQIACAGSGSGSNRCAFAPADECPANKPRTAADQSAFRAAVMMPAMMALGGDAAAHGQH
jgi:hypothetical protein